MHFVKELFDNRKLIMNLAKSDFKTKYAGSFLGIIWAFVQPVITVIVYSVVFQCVFAQPDIGNVPYVLWLITGLVPWFFFNDALNGGTNALLEYNYLVKKVVFKISILPIVKMISALFVHLFFIGFTVLIYAICGVIPGFTALQILYYMLCSFVFTLGITYITSAIVIFFRDLTQIISIVLQVGMWFTPILWNIDNPAFNLPESVRKILMLNPMYYIVCGYRDSLINEVWFWERPTLTLYFWCFTGLTFVVGIFVFKRLRVHFADVL
ncbi:MAG: ABC transporter permease [Lachnospiraceae bacterium]|nr:ABC transporter permease [Lachnospiraceae bacterium]